jgi:hypothetical protein
MDINLNVNQTNYDTMETVLDGIMTKLNNNKEALTKVLQHENGKVKIKDYIQNVQDPPWMKKIAQFRKELNDFLQDIGWEEE